MTAGARLRAELWAGLAAAAVVLPQATGFGVALLGPEGVAPGAAALAGLVGAAALCIGSGLLRGTPGLVSAPSGPVLVLLGGALAATRGEAEPAATLAAVLLLAGALQIAIGASGGGRAVKFIPYPVVAGFMTGSAILMALSQVEPVGGGGGAPEWRWLPAAVAAATLATVVLAPRLTPRVPPVIAGLILGTALFHAAVALGPGAAPEAWLVGSLPDPRSLEPGLRMDDVAALPWRTVALYAAALAVLASLDTLLTSVVADVATGARHDARRELVGQGLGQVAAGLAGGMGGAGTTGATMVSVQTGGRRLAPLVAGGLFVALVLGGGAVGRVLPLAVLAGVILRIALHMVEADILAWARRRRTRPDAGVAVLVTAVTVAFGLMVAVLLGVAISIVLFLREQVRAPVVHRRSTGAEIRSVRERTEGQRRLLDEHGDRVVVYELRGNLFFATADRLHEEIGPDLDRARWVVLHLRRVMQIDLTAIRILRQLASRLDASGGQLVICDLHKGAGAGRRMEKTLRKVSPGAAAPVKTVNGLDEAVEYCENALLESLAERAEPGAARVELADMDLCSGMDAAQVDSLAGYFEERRFERGAVIHEEGDSGSQLYVVVSGEVETRIPTTQRHHKRIGKYAPGTLFGEVALLTPGPRRADAIAVDDVELLVLTHADFERLCEERPDLAIALLTAIGKAQGEHLRWAAGEIRRLAEW